MLRLPKFKYLAPRTIKEAAKMLADHGSEAMLVAGGTDVFPKMKRRQFEPKTLIGLRQIKRFSGIQGSKNKGFSIRAGTRLNQLAAHPVIAKAYPGLARAASLISTLTLRNMGTVGGNLCLDTRCNYYDQTYHWRKALGFCRKSGGEVCRVAPGGDRCWAVSSADLIPVMIALGAQVHLVSASGERVIPVKELYRNDGIKFLTKAQDEILTEIMIPPADDFRSTYWKLRRRGAFDFPVLGVAIALRKQDGIVSEAKIVLGGIASCPLEMEQAEKLLLGQRLTPEIIEQAAQAVYEPVRPMDNTDLHLYYRKRMAPVYVRRALQELAELYQGASWRRKEKRGD